MLGRIVRWEAWGISCEANPKYRESVLENLGLKEDSKSLMSPGTRDADRDDDLLPKVLEDDRKYRSIVATINYMAADMPDLQFACKEVCREMSAPTCSRGRKSNASAGTSWAGRRWCGCSLGKTVMAV